MTTLTTPTVDGVRFHAMGCQAHVVVVGGPPGLTDKAIARVEELESLWSRFRPDSDISRANAAAGRPVTVSPLTVDLVGRALDAWRATAGRFDPTVLSALEALGYTDTFERVDPSSPDAVPAASPSAGCDGIVVDRGRSTVMLPSGVRFDAGGIGKGLAADLVTAELVAAGARGACVNFGGDLAALGDAPGPDGWTVGVEDPYDTTRDVAQLTVADQGVATSSRTYRTWERAGEQIHHLVDPATGSPAWTDLASVTVVAGSAAEAEVLAKAAFVAGPVDGAALIAEAGATGVMVDDGGFLRRLSPERGEVR